MLLMELLIIKESKSFSILRNFRFKINRFQGMERIKMESLSYKVSVKKITLNSQKFMKTKNK